MMPEKALSKIMRGGVTAGLLFMLAGVAVSLAGKYTEGLRVSVENLINGALLTDGAGLMYIGTLFIIATPVAVLIFLSIYYMFTQNKKYSIYCSLILVVLAFVTFMRY